MQLAKSIVWRRFVVGFGHDRPVENSLYKKKDRPWSPRLLWTPHWFLYRSFRFRFQSANTGFCSSPWEGRQGCCTVDGFRETGRRDLRRGRVADARGRNVCAVGTCVFLTNRKGRVTREAEKGKTTGEMVKKTKRVNYRNDDGAALRFDRGIHEYRK